MENPEGIPSIIAPAPATEAPSAAALDNLQFQRAEAITKKCSLCAGGITDEYYQLSGADLCPQCATSWQEAQRPPSAAGISRGVLYGFGAAIAGTILMAVVSAVTGYQLALIAIAVGWMVGTAFRKGTGGYGGRRCQYLAVALAYFGITMSFIPELIQAAKASAEKSDSAQPGAAKQKDNGKEIASLGEFAFATVVVVGVGLISPFLYLAAGFSGLINAFIVFLGLQRAWHLTGSDSRILAGPMHAGPEPQPATIEV